MSARGKYLPGPALGAHVEKDGERWALVIAREFPHPPELVWAAITEPGQLAEWAPFDVNRSLTSPGPVSLSTVGGPTPQVAESVVKRAEAPRLLEYGWGGNDLRFELKPTPGGTELKLWHNIDRRFIAWGAAGWHICLDVLAHLLSGAPLGRLVGPAALEFDWQRLNAEYAALFGIQTPPFPGARS